jgi:hypothetical protein
MIGNLLLTCIMFLTKCANLGNLKGSLVLLPLILLRDQPYLIAVAIHESLTPLRDQLYLMAVVMQASFIPLRDQLYLTAAGLNLSLISRDHLCLLALHLSSQGVCRHLYTLCACCACLCTRLRCLQDCCCPLRVCWGQQTPCGGGDMPYYIDIHLFFPYSDICLIFQVGEDWMPKLLAQRAWLSYGCGLPSESRHARLCMANWD